MVSTRRTPGPVADLTPAVLMSARQLPDARPPPPLPRTQFSELKTRKNDQNIAQQAMNLRTRVPAGHSSQGTPVMGRKDVEVNPDPPASKNVQTNEDSDAPEEETSAAVAATAKDQLRKERAVCRAVKKARRSRRRSDGAADEASITKGNSIAPELRNGTGKAEERTNEKGAVQKSEERSSLLLSEDILRAAASAIGDQRKSQEKQKLAIQLRKQKCRVGIEKSVALNDGMRVVIAGRTQTEISRTGGIKKSAAAFWQSSLKSGSRVSAAKAVRIASKKAVRARYGSPAR